jgi:hypothetical protein
MDRPIIIVAAIIVQILAARRSRLAGAIVGFWATTIVLIWGIRFYSQSGQALAFFFIPLSRGVFIVLCLIWYVLDVVSVVTALRERERSKAGPQRDAQQVEANAVESATQISDTSETRDLDNLIAALWEDDLKTRVKAMDALVKLRDPEAVAPLMEALKSDRWDKRWTAAETLGKLADPRAIGALRRALHDENALVKAVAADSLKTLTASPKKPD